jgi:hypothetical protein
MPKYQNVDVEHPRIIEAIKNLTKQEKRVEDISRVVGMPYEVVRKYMREEERKKK